MPSVHSKSAPSSSSSSLSHIVLSAVTLFGGALYGYGWWYGNIRANLNQCISCAEPQLFGSISSYCRGCNITLQCCPDCWPRYSREVHFFSCTKRQATTFQEEVEVQHATNRPLLTDPPTMRSISCSVCASPATTRCTRCLNEYYCSGIRQCAMTDWVRHKHRCRSVIKQFPAKQGEEAVSIRETKLPVDLIAHVESFLTFFQWSQAACVNHAWRNASLLPSGASHSTLTVDQSDFYDDTYLGDSARRTLLHLFHTNTSPVAASPFSSLQPPLPHFAHLRSFIFFDLSHPMFYNAQVGEYLVTMKKSLQKIYIMMSAFCSQVEEVEKLHQLGLLTQLREIQVHLVISKEFNEAVRQLVLLQFAAINFFVSDAYENSSTTFASSSSSASSFSSSPSASNEPEQQHHHRALFFEMLNVLAGLPILTHLRLISMSSNNAPPSSSSSITPFSDLFSSSTSSPVFSHITHFATQNPSCHKEGFVAFGEQFGVKFPAVQVFEFSQNTEVEESSSTTWLLPLLNALHRALNSVIDTLTEVQLMLPTNHSIIHALASIEASKKLQLGGKEKNNNKTVPKHNHLTLFSVRTLSTDEPSLIEPYELKSSLSYLSHLTRFELNLQGKGLFTRYVDQILKHLIELKELEYLSLYNVGLLNDATEEEVQMWKSPDLDGGFKKKRDAHRDLKYVQISPAAHVGSVSENDGVRVGDMYFIGQILLLYLPRVTRMCYERCMIEVATLWKLARRKGVDKVVWYPVTNEDSEGIHRVSSLHVLHEEEEKTRDYFSSSSKDEIKSFNIPKIYDALIQEFEGRPNPSPKNPPRSCTPELFLLSRDFYTMKESPYPGIVLKELDTFSEERCQSLEFTNLFVFQLPQQVEDTNSLMHALMEFAGLDKHFVYATQYEDQVKDRACKRRLFQLMKEREGWNTSENNGQQFAPDWKYTMDRVTR